MTPTPVVLGSQHTAFLDNLRTAISGRTDRAVSRSEIIRAMIDAVAASAIDLATADNEEQICTTLSARLTR